MTNMIVVIRGMNDPIIGWDKYMAYLYWASTKLKSLFPYEIKSYTEMGRRLRSLSIEHLLKLVHAEGEIQRLLFQQCVVARGGRNLGPKFCKDPVLNFLQLFTQEDYDRTMEGSSPQLKRLIRMIKAYVVVMYDNDHQRDIIKMFKKLQYEQMLAVMEESNATTKWLQGMGMEIPQLPVDIADINIAQVAIYIPPKVADYITRDREEKMRAAG